MYRRWIKMNLFPRVKWTNTTERNGLQDLNEFWYCSTSFKLKESEQCGLYKANNVFRGK